jgi:hypothetical protein
MILDNGKENKKEGIIESEKSIDEKSEDVSLSIIKKIQDEKDSK